MRRLSPLLVLLALGCGGKPQTLVPQSINASLEQFMAAVKANDITRMGQLWGDQRGPASSFMKPDVLRQKLVTIQKYLDHKGYRVIEGPLPAQPLNPTFKDVPTLDNLRDFRIELQRETCNHVLPITVVRVKSGGWIVYDVHLESAGNPMQKCQPAGSGTGP